MPLSHWNLQFRDHNSQRKYPLADFATGNDVTGSFELPDDFLVGLDLPIHAAMDMNPGGFFIRELGVFPTGFSITVSYDSVDGVVDVATASIPRTNHTRYKTYNLGGLEPYDDISGKVLIGRLDSIDAQPAGLWTFDIDGAPLEPDCIRPWLRGVTAIILRNGAEESEPITGDLVLEAGTNVQLVPILVEGENPRIRVDAIEGEGLTQDCLCVGDAAETPCIQKINGIPPTDDGNFNLIGDTCFEFVQTDNGLQLVDKCCAPCCDCTDLEAITRDLDRFNTERATFKLFVEQLLASVTQMSETVLGARLGDRGCNAGE
jgi:hypothetical protein